MGRIKAIWIDANFIIYYLKTNKDFTPKVQLLVDEARKGNIELKISPLIISECVFILTSKNFRVTKEKVKAALISFINIPGVIMEEKYVIEEALNNFASTEIDFTNAFIIAHARSIKSNHIVVENIEDFKGLNILAEINSFNAENR